MITAHLKESIGSSCHSDTCSVTVLIPQSFNTKIAFDSLCGVTPVHKKFHTLNLKLTVFILELICLKKDMESTLK